MTVPKEAATVRGMAKRAAAGVDVAVVEEHLARYAVSCPLCKAVDRLGVGQQQCELASSGGDKDSIPLIVVVCTRCGYLMPLAADRIAPEEKAA
jgi:Zn ribbon nucleic-acid-binding protein